MPSPTNPLDELLKDPKYAPVVELMNKLKKTLNVEELQESKHDNGDKDERTNKMIKEAKELGYV